MIWLVINAIVFATPIKIYSVEIFITLRLCSILADRSMVWFAMYFPMNGRVLISEINIFDIS